MIIRKRRKSGLVIAVIAGIASLLSGCFIDKNLAAKPYVESSVVSDYVVRHGGLVRGRARQDLVNVNLNGKWSAFIWQNYSDDEKKFNERDFGITYSSPINDRTSVRIGYTHFTYPSGTFGNYDNAIEGGIHYSNGIDLDFGLTQLLPHGQIENGTRCYVKASKSFTLYRNKDLNVSISPSISTAHVSNYYGLTGFSQITPGLSLDCTKKGFSINLFINNQFGQIPEIENVTWKGGTISYKF